MRQGLGGGEAGIRGGEAGVGGSEAGVGGGEAEIGGGEAGVGGGEAEIRGGEAGVGDDVTQVGGAGTGEDDMMLLHNLTTLLLIPFPVCNILAGWHATISELCRSSIIERVIDRHVGNSNNIHIHNHISTYIYRQENGA